MKPTAKPEWIRPTSASSKPRWGIRGGLQFALWPAALEGTGEGGPRGLVRVGYPVGNGELQARLVNFIAVEPEVRDHPKGYSELEPSVGDGKPGKPMWASPVSGGSPDAGTLSRPDSKHPEIEELSVTVHMEKFANGAHPYLRLAVRSDRPDELRLQTFHESDSAPMERCILTATMGNLARLRLLHLKEGEVDARQLYPGYEGDAFTGDGFFDLPRLCRNAQGSVIVPLTTDEKDPASVQPFLNNAATWRWRGTALTQYWRKEPGEARSDLQVRVNARRMYWMSHQPIPGGLAYENVEFREGYRPGTTSLFGMTRRSPADLLR